MKIDNRGLVLALCVLCAGANCSTGDLPSCDNFPSGRRRIADLTGAPQFTASLIAPGQPLALAVPVDEHVRFVEAGIRRAENADTGPLLIVVLTAETDGAETVRLPLEDTDLATGLYFAESIVLAWDEYPEDRYTYASSDAETPYILSTTFHFELAPVSCQSDVSVPTFEVVGD